MAKELLSRHILKPFVKLKRTYFFYPPVRDFVVPEKVQNVEYPERRKLRFFEKVPTPFYSGQRVPKMPKQLIDIRGPELVHTFLLHKQYGIRALQGGQLHHGHFEMIRNGINRKLEESRMFAVWRVDPPWKPITKKGQGHRMGGGKGNIDHYVTPVKAQRIILEFGGQVLYNEAYEILVRVAQKLPFKADVVNEDILREEREQAETDAATNLNPFSFKFCVEKNMFGCRKWISPYDRIWHGKYR